MVFSYGVVKNQHFQSMFSFGREGGGHKKNSTVDNVDKIMDDIPKHAHCYNQYTIVLSLAKGLYS